MKYKILVVNPGSTSTKVAVYEGEERIFSKNLQHSATDVGKYDRICDQFEFRRDMILEELKAAGIDLSCIDAVAGRGGNMKPVSGGTYRVNEAMLKDLAAGVMGQHASNLGGIIADSIAKIYGIEAFVTDPVVVDEFEDYARISGMPEIIRKSKDHPLNQKAAARKCAHDLGGSYEDYNFIVAHLGGGISVGMHKKGRIVDVNNCLDGDGPFSPERSGGLPVGALVDMCFSGQYTKDEIRRKITGKGGLVAYLGTNDTREVQQMIAAGDERARMVYETMAYQVSKEIGAAAAVLSGDVDAIVLTGGIAYDDMFNEWIRDRVSFIAPVMVYPGENELEALAQGAIRVLSGEEEAKIYK